MFFFETEPVTNICIFQQRKVLSLWLWNLVNASKQHKLFLGMLMINIF